MKTILSNELEERFLHFGVSVIKLTQLQKEKLPFSVIDQAIRASTSNKIYIAKKEASETRYWLLVITELTDENTTLSYLKEVQEILLILQKIVSTLKTGISK